MFAIVLQGINLLSLITIPQLIISDSYNLKYIKLNTEQWLASTPGCRRDYNITEAFWQATCSRIGTYWDLEHCSLGKYTGLGESVFLQHVVALVIL